MFEGKSASQLTEPEKRNNKSSMKAPETELLGHI